MDQETIESEIEATLARVLALITAHARAASDCEREILASQAAKDLAALSNSPRFSGKFASITSRLADHWRNAAQHASGRSQMMR